MQSDNFVTTQAMDRLNTLGATPDCERVDLYNNTSRLQERFNKAFSRDPVPPPIKDGGVVGVVVTGTPTTSSNEWLG